MSPHPALEAEENFATTAVLQCTRAVCCWWGLLSLLFPAGAVCSRWVCYWCRLPSASTSILGFAPASYAILLAPSTISCQINVLLSLTVYPAGIKFLRSEETCSGRGTWHPVCCQVGAAALPKEGWCCARGLLYRCDNSLPATDPIWFSASPDSWGVLPKHVQASSNHAMALRHPGHSLEVQGLTASPILGQALTPPSHTTCCALLHFYSNNNIHFEDTFSKGLLL